MTIKEELLYDFSFHRPRILLGNGLGIVDHVKKLMILEKNTIVVDCGLFFVSVSGHDLDIDSMEDQRLLLKGEIEKVELYKGKDAKDA